MRRLLVVALLVLGGCGGGGDGGDGGDAAPAAVAGDPARGKIVFERSACAACHTFSGSSVRMERNAAPNLDAVAAMYDAEFIRSSIVDPSAYTEKGFEGRIGGDRPYSNTMPAYGPDELPPQHLTEQELRDLVAFIENGGKR